MRTVSRETAYHLFLDGYHELCGDPPSALPWGLTMITKKLIPGKAAGSSPRWEEPRPKAALGPRRGAGWFGFWTADASSQLYLLWSVLVTIRHRLGGKLPHTPSRDYDVKSVKRIMANKINQKDSSELLNMRTLVQEGMCFLGRKKNQSVCALLTSELKSQFCSFPCYRT